MSGITRKIQEGLDAFGKLGKATSSGFTKASQTLKNVGQTVANMPDAVTSAINIATSGSRKTNEMADMAKNHQVNLSLAQSQTVSGGCIFGGAEGDAEPETYSEILLEHKADSGMESKKALIDAIDSIAKKYGAKSDTPTKRIQELMTGLKPKGSMASLCKDVAITLNGLFKESVIDVSENNTERICQQVLELLRAITVGINYEFLRVYNSIKTNIKNINDYKTVADALRDRLNKVLEKSTDVTVRTEIAKVGPALDFISESIQHQLNNLSLIFMGTLEERHKIMANMFSKFENNGSFFDVAKPAKMSISEYTEKMLRTLGLAGAYGVILRSSLDKLGITEADYLAMNKAVDLEEATLKAIAKHDSPKAAEDIMKAAKLLKDNFDVRGDLKTGMGEKHGSSDCNPVANNNSGLVSGGSTTLYAEQSRFGNDFSAFNGLARWNGGALMGYDDDDYAEAIAVDDITGGGGYGHFHGTSELSFDGHLTTNTGNVWRGGAEEYDKTPQEKALEIRREIRSLVYSDFYRKYNNNRIRLADAIERVANSLVRGDDDLGTSTIPHSEELERFISSLSALSSDVTMGDDYAYYNLIATSVNNTEILVRSEFLRKVNQVIKAIDELLALASYSQIAERLREVKDVLKNIEVLIGDFTGKIAEQVSKLGGNDTVDSAVIADEESAFANTTGGCGSCGGHNYSGPGVYAGGAKNSAKSKGKSKGKGKSKQDSAKTAEKLSTRKNEVRAKLAKKKGGLDDSFREQLADERPANVKNAVTIAIMKLKMSADINRSLDSLARVSRDRAEYAEQAREINSKSLSEYKANSFTNHSKVLETLNAILKEAKSVKDADATKGAEAAIRIVKAQIESKTEFWKAVGALDEYIHKFGDAVVAKPFAVVTSLRAALDDTPMASRIYDDDTELLLSRSYEIMCATDAEAKTIVSTKSVSGVISAVPVPKTTSATAEIAEESKEQLEVALKAFAFLKNILSAAFNIGQKELVSSLSMKPGLIHEALMNYIVDSSYTFLYDVSADFSVVGGQPTLGGQQVALVDITNVVLRTTGAASRGISFVEEDIFLESIIKALAAKILVVLNLATLQDRHNENFAFGTVRTIMGGNNGLPDIVPANIALYLRLPLLMLFYRDLFATPDFENIPGLPRSSTMAKISMMSDATGKFGGIIQFAFNDIGDAQMSGLSDEQISRIIREVNAIAKSYTGTPEEITTRVLDDLISEVNRRYGLITDKELEASRAIEYESYHDFKTGFDNSLTGKVHPRSVEILDGEELVRGSRRKHSANTDFVLDGDKKKQPYNIVKSYYDLIRNFRKSIEDKFTAARTAEKFQFRDAIKFTSAEVKQTTSIAEKYNLVADLIKCKAITSSVDNIKYVMYHETVIAGTYALAVYASIITNLSGATNAFVDKYFVEAIYSEVVEHIENNNPDFKNKRVVNNAFSAALANAEWATGAVIPGIATVEDILNQDRDAYKWLVANRADGFGTEKAAVEILMFVSNIPELASISIDAHGASGNFGALKRCFIDLYEGTSYFFENLRDQIDPACVEHQHDASKKYTLAWFKTNIVDKHIRGVAKTNARVKGYPTIDNFPELISEAWKVASLGKKDVLSDALISSIANNRNHAGDVATVAPYNSNGIDELLFVADSRAKGGVADTRFVKRYPLYSWDSIYGSSDDSVLIKFNQILAGLIGATYDPMTKKMYHTVVDTLVNSNIGPAVADPVVNTYPDTRPQVAIQGSEYKFALFDALGYRRTCTYPQVLEPFTLAAYNSNVFDSAIKFAVYLLQTDAQAPEFDHTNQANDNLYANVISGWLNNPQLYQPNDGQGSTLLADIRASGSPKTRSPQGGANTTPVIASQLLQEVLAWMQQNKSDANGLVYSASSAYAPSKLVDTFLKTSGHLGTDLNDQTVMQSVAQYLWNVMSVEPVQGNAEVDPTKMLVSLNTNIAVKSGRKSLFITKDDAYTEQVGYDILPVGGVTLVDPSVNDSLLNGNVSVRATYSTPQLPRGTHFVFASIASILRSINSPSPTGASAPHKAETVGDVSEYMREQIRANLPYIIHYAKHLRSDCQLYSAMTRNAAVLKVSKSSAADHDYVPWNQNAVYAITDGSDMNRSEAVDFFEAVSSALDAVIRACEDTLRDIGHVPKLLEIYSGSINSIRAKTGTEPFIPISVLLTPIVDANIAAYLPVKKQGTSQCKWLMASRAVVASDSVPSERVDGWANVVNAYNTSDGYHSTVDMTRADLFAQSIMQVLRSVIMMRKHDGLSTGRTNTMLSAITTEFVGAVTPWFASLNTSEVVAMIESGDARKKSAEAIGKLFGSTKTIKENDSLIIQNILDIGKFPIDVNALSREIPFAELFNYSITYDQCVREYIERGANPTPARNSLLKMVSSPMDLSLDFRDLRDVVEGVPNHGTFGSPEFISDVVYETILMRGNKDGIKDRDADLGGKVIASLDGSIIANVAGPTFQQSMAKDVLTNINRALSGSGVRGAQFFDWWSSLVTAIKTTCSGTDDLGKMRANVLANGISQEEQAAAAQVLKGELYENGKFKLDVRMPLSSLNSLVSYDKFAVYVTALIHDYVEHANSNYVAHILQGGPKLPDIHVGDFSKAGYSIGNTITKQSLFQTRLNASLTRNLMFIVNTNRVVRVALDDSLRRGRDTVVKNTEKAIDPSILEFYGSRTNKDRLDYLDSKPTSSFY